MLAMETENQCAGLQAELYSNVLPRLDLIPVFTHTRTAYLYKNPTLIQIFFNWQPKLDYFSWNSQLHVHHLWTCYLNNIYIRSREE